MKTEFLSEMGIGLADSDRNLSAASVRSAIIKDLLVRENMDHKGLLKALLKRKSVFKGTFTLASGRISNYYLDCKRTTLDPQGAILTGYTILELLKIKRIQADAIGGPTVGADPIVTAVAAVSWLEHQLSPLQCTPLPAFFVREERKSHGRQNQIEGIDLNEGPKKVVIVDEVCTTGDSTIRALNAAREAGFKIVAVISLVDREEGGSDRLRKEYNYIPIFTAKELLEDDPEDARGSGTTSEDALERVGRNARNA
jgi:orotate phosphoribosyltransferase